jgi:hypothetical protein
VEDPEEDEQPEDFIMKAQNAFIHAMEQRDGRARKRALEECDELWRSEWIDEGISKDIPPGFGRLMRQPPRHWWCSTWYVSVCRVQWQTAFFLVYI